MFRLLFETLTFFNSISWTFHKFSRLYKKSENVRRNLKSTLRLTCIWVNKVCCNTFLSLFVFLLSFLALALVANSFWNNYEERIDSPVSSAEGWWDPRAKSTVWLNNTKLLFYAASLDLGGDWFFLLHILTIVATWIETNYLSI